MFEKVNWEVVVTILLASISALWALREYLSHRKSLVYNVMSNIPLVRINEDAVSRIKILFDGKPVSDVRMAVIKIVNKGSSIASRDFESPLVFFLGEQAQIMSAEVFKTKPRDLKLELHVSDDKIQIPPLLLNTGDSITLKIIGVSLISENIEAKARILGVNEVKRGDTDATFPDLIFSYLFLADLVILGISMSGSIILRFFSKQYDSLFEDIVRISFYIFVALLIFGAIYFNVTRRKSKSEFV